MVEGKASAFLGSPRMVEAVIGEKVSLEDLGGARMHCSVSGLGDALDKSLGISRVTLYKKLEDYNIKPTAVYTGSDSKTI